MLIVVVNGNSISKSQTCILSSAISKSIGSDAVVLDVFDGEPIRFFSLGSVPDVSVEELRAILTAQFPTKPWPQRVYEWWQSRKQVQA